MVLFTNTFYWANNNESTTKLLTLKQRHSNFDKAKKGEVVKDTHIYSFMQTKFVTSLKSFFGNTLIHSPTLPTKSNGQCKLR